MFLDLLLKINEATLVQFGLVVTGSYLVVAMAPSILLQLEGRMFRKLKHRAERREKQRQGLKKAKCR